MEASAIVASISIMTRPRDSWRSTAILDAAADGGQEQTHTVLEVVRHQGAVRVERRATIGLEHELQAVTLDEPEFLCRRGDHVSDLCSLFESGDEFAPLR